jgi:hypothetical protein
MKQTLSVLFADFVTECYLHVLITSGKFFACADKTAKGQKEKESDVFV